MYNNITGRVDDRLRPVVHIRMADSDAVFLARIDTAFEGSLLLDLEESRRLGLARTPFVKRRMLADGTDLTTSKWRGRIEWTDGVRTTDEFELCLIEDCPRDSATGLPIGLIGTDLLSGHKLTIEMIIGGAVHLTRL